MTLDSACQKHLTQTLWISSTISGHGVPLLLLLCFDIDSSCVTIMPSPSQSQLAEMNGRHWHLQASSQGITANCISPQNLYPHFILWLEILLLEWSKNKNKTLLNRGIKKATPNSLVDAPSNTEQVGLESGCLEQVWGWSELPWKSQRSFRASSVLGQEDRKSHSLLQLCLGLFFSLNHHAKKPPGCIDQGIMKHTYLQTLQDAASKRLGEQMTHFFQLLSYSKVLCREGKGGISSTVWIPVPLV